MEIKEEKKYQQMKVKIIQRRGTIKINKKI